MINYYQKNEKIIKQINEIVALNNVQILIYSNNVSQNQLENRFDAVGEELTNTIYNLKYNKSWDDYD